MSSQKKYDFGAGVCVLPDTVREQAASEARTWQGMGPSVPGTLKYIPGHQSVLSRATLMVKELLSVPPDYDVLFLQDVENHQFSVIPSILLHDQSIKKGAYLDTGHFSQKAIAEVKVFGEARVVGSSRKAGYSYIPKNYLTPDDVAYLHFTCNNTIEGTQVTNFPAGTVSKVCDMSPDIFARSISIKEFDLIYARRQKNMGPAGMNLVILKKELRKHINHRLPGEAGYQHNSLFNIPSVFSLYVLMLNMLWIKAQGGVDAMEKKYQRMARLLYQAIDQSEIFYCPVNKTDRSIMSVIFKTIDPDQEAAFLKYAGQRGITGIRGSRAAGGFRICLHNALHEISLKCLARVISNFETAEKMKSANAELEQITAY